MKETFNFGILEDTVFPYCFETYACTGKSLSEALPFAEHGKNMLCTEIVLNVENNFCTQHGLSMF